MKSKLTIYSVFHKPFYVPPLSFIKPIWAGKEGKQIVDFEMEGDNTGDNISRLNDYFCETTVLYWIWKNGKMKPNDIWGLCHYRRYFTNYKRWYRFNNFPIYRLPQQAVIDSYVNSNIENLIKHQLQHADVIVTHPVNISLKRKIAVTIKDQYIQEHSASDWQLLKEVLSEKFPAYAHSFELLGSQTKMSIANMMIARTSIWNDYLTWLFEILFEMYKRLPATEDSYQKRSLGFMAERLMNLYILHNHLKTAGMQLVIFNKK